MHPVLSALRSRSAVFGEPLGLHRQQPQCLQFRCARIEFAITLVNVDTGPIQAGDRTMVDERAHCGQHFAGQRQVEQRLSTQAAEAKGVPVLPLPRPAYA
jgi:hypothetical protein